MSMLELVGNAFVLVSGIGAGFVWGTRRDKPQPSAPPLAYPPFYASVIDGERVADVSTNLYRIRCRCLEEHSNGRSTKLVTYEARKAERIR